jgi:hypothetical protein
VYSFPEECHRQAGNSCIQHHQSEAWTVFIGQSCERRFKGYKILESADGSFPVVIFVVVHEGYSYRPYMPMVCYSEGIKYLRRGSREA